MENRDTIISEFCEGTKKVLQKDLYGIVIYGNPIGSDFDICVVYHQNKNPDVVELKKLKERVEDKYGIELDILLFPPDVFSEALSRMVSNLNLSILAELDVKYGGPEFHSLITESAKNPIDKWPLKVDEYKL